MNVRLELFVQDMDVAIAFYQRILGFELVRSRPNYAPMHRGEVRIGLGPIAELAEEHYFRERNRAEKRGLGVEIVLEVDDIDEEYRHVLSQGYPIQEPLQPRAWGLTDFRLVDPDGYYLRITSCA